MMKCFIFSLVSVVVLLETASCFTINQNSTDEKSSIVGGGPVGLLVPYHVALRCNNTYFCGGTLISAQVVLTAAHCIEYMQKARCFVTVQAGSIHRDFGGAVVEMTRAFIHPEYVPVTPTALRPSEHDIGVIELQNPFILSQIIFPIALTPFPPINYEMITMTGFGLTSFGPTSEGSQILKQYSSQLLTYEECTKRLSPTRVFPSDFCDSGRINESICSGDSGGPVVNSNGYLIGVTSRTFRPECTGIIPNAFASVYHHLDFINSFIR